MIQIAISAILAVVLIASLVMYLAPPSGTGLFMEEHGNCADVIGGVTVYKECGYNVAPVNNINYFGPRNTHTPFYASGEQQGGLFEQKYYIARRVLETQPPRYEPASFVGEDLEGQPHNVDRANSRRYLSADPYKGTPWSWDRS